MDKNKSEKLKEILNQTISQEEIEEKLKKEIKSAAIKKAEQKKIEEEQLKKAAEDKIEEQKLQKNNPEIAINNEPLQKTTEEKIEEKVNHKLNEIEIETKREEDGVEEKVIIPSVREKKKENRDINILLYLVGTIALLLFLVVIYLFINKGNLSGSNLSTDKKEISTEKFYEEKILEENREIKIEPKAIKNDTVIKEPMIKVQENIEKIIKEEKPKEIIKEVIKERVITKVVKLDKKNFKTYYNSAKFNSLKCYNFKAGDVFPTNTCKKNLAKFLKENKNALRFEVIPVIAENDNIIFNKMQSNMKSMDKAFQDRVKEYMYRGLSRERVLETTWYIKDILGEDSILTPTNYYVKSKKNNKGIIVKAYH